MIDLSDKYLMMIEPDHTELPVNDRLSTMTAELFRSCRQSSPKFAKRHICQCGQVSDNQDWILPNGMITNSLLLHYVVYHRSSIPDSEIVKLRRLYEELVK